MGDWLKTGLFYRIVLTSTTLYILLHATVHRCLSLVVHRGCDFLRVIEFVHQHRIMHGDDTTTNRNDAIKDEAAETVLQTLDDIITSASDQPLSKVSVKIIINLHTMTDLSVLLCRFYSTCKLMCLLLVSQHWQSS